MSSQRSPHISVKEVKGKKSRTAWKELFNPGDSWEFRAPGLKLSDADQAHRYTPLVISTVFGRTASPSLAHLEMLSPYDYGIGSTRLTAEKLHSHSSAAVCWNTTTQTYREVKYATRTGRTWGFTPKRSSSSFSSNILVLKKGNWVLLFSECSLLYTIVLV